VDVTEIFQQLQVWMLAQTRGGTADLDRLVCAALGLLQSGWQDPAGLHLRNHGRRRGFHCPGDPVLQGALSRVNQIDAWRQSG